MMLQFLLIFGCGEEAKPLDLDTADSAVPEPTSEPSEEDTGTDEDGDGFSVEDGDCDDTSPWINPARDEEPNDGVDNDCDGKIDEKWSGVTISLFKDGSTSSLLTLNQLGNVESELSLSNDCMPTYLAHDNSVDGGFVISNANTGVARVSPTGECTLLADFSEDEENASLYGVLGQADGSVIASRGDSLIKIMADGSLETIVEWDANVVDEEGNPNPNYQVFVWSIARDILTEEIALFGLYGGFATWHADTGLIVHRAITADTWDGRYAYAGAEKDGGGWYTLLYALETGEISVDQFDESSSDWLTQKVWSEADQSAQQFAIPNGITIDGDSGDYYVTADVASYSSVFRIRNVEGGVPDDLYRSNSQPSWTFFGIISNY